MTLSGDTGAIGKPCTECGQILEAKVLISAAGYYIGTRCDNTECDARGQPNSRESKYFSTYTEASAVLESSGYSR